MIIAKTGSQNILSEKLRPCAQFVEYDARSPHKATSPRNGCTKNTRTAILRTLQEWANDKKTTKVYWLNGMAGTGKTTIAYSFSEMLDKQESLGGTFFASHLLVDTSDVNCIIPTISLQLAKYFPFLGPLILDAVEGNPSCSSWRISRQFLNFMVKPLTAAFRDNKDIVATPVIVLDALDECSDQSLVAELLSVILEHSKVLPVKFSITSRPEVLVKETFDHNWGHSNLILHEVEKEIVQADIELYIKACLVSSYNKPNWPSKAEVERLVNMSGTLFIYAATVCKYIAQRGSSSMPQRLSDVVDSTLETTSGLTHPLDALYERILSAAYTLANQREKSYIKLVLTAVVYAYNPLSMTAISGLMQISTAHIEAALSSLHSLIHVPFQDPNIPISILHASFYDFISSQSHSLEYYLDPCASHKSLAFQCLLLMDKEWSGRKNVSYLAERRRGEISESLAYACCYWASHFTYTNNNPGSDILKHFFETHLLRWIDCLSIMGKLETAMHSLLKLKSQVSSLITAKINFAKNRELDTKYLGDDSN